MGCVRRGKKQKQGPKTLTKQEATGRTSAHVLKRVEVARAMNRAMRESSATPGLLAATALMGIMRR